MIRAGDRVASVLARDEKLIEVFVQASPAFERLRNATMRRTMGQLVTVEQAARIAGVEASVLVAGLNQAFSGAALNPQALAPQQSHASESAPMPDLLCNLAQDRIVDLDVREDLRDGREPFHRIMAAVHALPGDGVLRVRAIFEPAPLYAVLGKRGLTHFTECLGVEDYRVWFYRCAPSAPPPDGQPTAPGEAPAEAEDLVLLDVRGLEPPEPMVQTLEALAVLPRGKTLVQLNVRIPQFLLPKLEERGFQYEIREQSADLVRLFIRHKQP